MPKRLSEFTRSLRRLGEIEIHHLEFLEFLNRDIKDLEIGESLRKLGNTKVMDWDFESTMPEVHRLAYTELDLVELMKRAAHYKVLEWDFRSLGASSPPPPSRKEMDRLTSGLKSFLWFAVANLVDEPERAEIRIHHEGTDAVRFTLLVSQNDVKDFIGRGGATAAAIRNLLKEAAAASGVRAWLKILSHEEELALR